MVKQFLSESINRYIENLIAITINYVEILLVNRNSTINKTFCFEFAFTGKEFITI
jgi:hypothetical protein